MSNVLMMLIKLLVSVTGKMVNGTFVKETL